MLDKDDLRMAVEANVEDFYGDTDIEPSEIPQMAVEDAVNNCLEEVNDEEWNELMGFAEAQYQLMYEEDHR